MPTRRLNGFRLHYTVRGTGPALVYVHGGFASLDRVLREPDPEALRWQDAFAEHLMLVSYHRRGCESSSCPHGGYDLPNQARDLEALLDQLGLPDAHLFASSAGGPIALLFAATRPRRVRSVSIQGSALRILRPGDGVYERALAGHRILWRDGPAAASKARPRGSEFSLTVEWDRREAAAAGRLEACVAEERMLTARAGRLQRYTRVRYHAAELRNLCAYADIDLRPVAARVRAPTLVQHGARDQVFESALGRELADAIPGAEFAALTDAGHLPVFTEVTARDRAIEFALRHQRPGPACRPPVRQRNEDR
jgi:pimeloyl-ACP methyl ester carboxylesterase